MLVSLLIAVATLVVLEVVILVWRRTLGGGAGRFLPHAWAILTALAAGLARGYWSLRPRPWPWQLLLTLVLVLSVLVLFRLVEELVLERPWDPKRGPLVPSLLRDVVRFFLLITAGIVAATYIHGLSLPTVLVSSTVVSAVVGLALQDLLKNVFAGVAIQLEGNLRVGDWLLVEDVPAEVVGMSWRSTRLRTNEGVELIEPNATVAERQLVNYGSGNRPVALHFRVGLPYETPPARAREALLAAARSAPGALKDPSPVALLRSYDDSAIQYELRVWTRQVSAISRFRDAVNARIWYEIQRAGLYVPFPIRNVHFRPVDEAEAEARRRETVRVAALLSRIELFADLADEVRTELAAAARKQHFDDGEHLVREGDAGDSLFLVDAGRVLVSKSGAVIGTGSVGLASLQAGDVFGESSLLTGAPRNATVTADGPCEVLVLAKHALAPLLEADPSLAESFSRTLAERQAATEAVLEERRSRHRPEEAPVRDPATILGRIRKFFRLPQS